MCTWQTTKGRRPGTSTRDGLQPTARTITPISELAADRTGALSPYGDLTFPLPADEVPYTHPITVVNK